MRRRDLLKGLAAGSLGVGLNIRPTLATPGTSQTADAALTGSGAASQRAIPASMPAGRMGLRLDGTFIQYQSSMMRMDARAWQRELQAMQRAGLRTIIIQCLEHDAVSFIPEDGESPDPTEIILEYADTAGMEVWLGLAMMDAWWKGAHDPAVLGRIADRCRDLAERAWSRYGRHKSLVGWYIPPEPWDDFAPECVANLRAFLRRISDGCRQLSAGKLVGLSPYLTGAVEAAALREKFAELLTGAGIDVVLLQDSVGARCWDNDVYRIRPYFRAMRDACLRSGVELWSDVEVFRIESTEREGKTESRFLPADAARLARQLTAAAPFVTRLVAFDCYHYMSPYRGERQKQFYDAYLRGFVDKPFYPVHGPSVTVDAHFAYYRNRSAESMAAEIRANGYSIVHYVADPASRVQPEVLRALRAAGIGTWYMSFAHTTFHAELLPKGWRRWRMVSRHDRAGGKPFAGFEHLCPNNVEYREWKKRDMAAALRSAPFDAVEIVEAHWPEYPGVDAPGYSCFCHACEEAFCKMFPGEQALPDIINPDSPVSPGRNPELWTKWLKFREATMTGFLDDLLNGKGGLRESAPGTPVCVWGYGLAEENAIERVLKDSGQDVGRVVRQVRPDAYCIQTHWPDWTRADLPPDYVTRYKPFLDQVRQADSRMPLMIQADIGSTKEAVRDRAWVEQFEAACQAMGVASTTLYEYFIAGWSYREPPRVAGINRQGSRIELCFTRRLDPASAQRRGAIVTESARIVHIQVDGNLVRLQMDGPVPKGMSICLEGIDGDARTRLFPEMEAAPPVKERILLP